MSYPLVYKKGSNGWDYQLLEKLTGGLNKSSRPDSIQPVDLLTADNVYVYQDRLLGDTGYKVFAVSVTDVPQAMYQMYYRSGLSELLMVTTHNLYRYVPATNSWAVVYSPLGIDYSTYFMSAYIGDHANAAFDVTATSDPDWNLHFGEGIASVYYYSTYTGAGGHDSGIQGTKTIPLNPNITYRLYAYNSSYNGDLVSFTLEFLNSASTVIACIGSTGVQYGGGFNHELRYGTTSLSNAAAAVGMNTTDGLVSFTANSMVFTNTRGANYNGSFSVNCSGLTITAVRVSNVRVVSGSSGVPNLYQTSMAFQKSTAVPQGNYPLHGDLDHQVTIVPIPAMDQIVFTNGIDPVQYYDGTTFGALPGLSELGVNTATAVATYNAALFLLGTTEGGMHRPQRIRRSDVGDITEWEANLAGYDDLYDDADKILCAYELGPYLIVYRQNSITRGQFTNSGGKTYEWITTIDKDGAASTLSVVPLSSKHLLFSKSGIFSYDGWYDLVSIGDKIFDKIFPAYGDLATEYISRIFAFEVEFRKEVWFMYPATGATLPNTTMRYSLDSGSWTVRKFKDTFVGAHPYRTITAKRWLDLVGTWAEQTWHWDDRTVANTVPVMLLANSGGQVYQYDYTVRYEGAGGNTVSYTVDTMDFYNRGFSMRFDQLDVCMYSYTGVQAYYSTDGGSNWVLLGTMASEITAFNQQVVCDKIRFRLVGNSANAFELAWMGFEVRLESSYRKG